MQDSLEQVYPFSPASFFQFMVEVPFREELPANAYKKPYLLPDFSDFLDEESFAKVALSWGEKGLYLAFFIDKPFEDVDFPNIQSADAIELFFDTRDLKTSASIHKFCHHFIFLPKEVGEIRSVEVSKFRAEDAHPLVDPSLLQSSVEFGKKSYEMRIFIPNEALFGFDPKQFTRIGFTYRIHGKGRNPQHFNLSFADYNLERYPSLWATLKLNKS